MKWQARKYSRASLRVRWQEQAETWHTAFAWRPVRIEERKHDSIVVPAHYVWLEYCERRSTRWRYTMVPFSSRRIPTSFEYRPYTGTVPTLRQLVHS